MMEISIEELNGKVLRNKLSMMLDDDDRLSPQIDETHGPSVEGSAVQQKIIEGLELEESEVIDVKEQQDKQEVKVIASSVLDKTFSLRDLITYRFNTENHLPVTDNLILQAIIESLRSCDLDPHNDEGFKSIVLRALAPTDKETAFQNIEEIESAINDWNTCEAEVVVVDTPLQSLLSVRLEEALLATEEEEEDENEDEDEGEDLLVKASEQTISAAPIDTGVFNTSASPEIAVTPLLSKLEKLEREQDAIIEEKATGITHGAILNGRYVVLEVQNKSKLLTTYKALDIMSDKGITIDVLNSSDEEHNKLFRIACEAAVKVKHTNLIESIECIESSGKTLCLREFIEGLTLSRIISEANQTQTEGQIASIIIQICDALGELHRCDLVHGNLNTDNVLVIENEGKSHVKVSGVGSREVKDQLVEQRKLRLDLERYGSYEHYSKIKNESSIDLFDLATIAYELVSGALPFSDTNGEINQIPALSDFRSDIIEIDQLDRIIRCGLSLNDDEKFDGMEEFKSGILAWIERVREVDPSRADDRFKAVIAEAAEVAEIPNEELQEDESLETSSFMPSRMFARLLTYNADSSESKLGRQKLKTVNDASDKSSKDENDSSLVGQVLFGRYSVIDTIGKGETSTVYAATDLKFDRIVAIKQLISPTPETEPNFNKAIDKYRTFQHPNLIKLLDCRSIDDSPCVILEYAQGETLRSFLNRSKHVETEARIIRIALQICSLLTYLHEKNFAHGNLSTNSIILVESSADSLIKVGGLCASGVAYEAIDKLRSSSDANIERNLSEKINSDLRAVAAIIYEMITGIKLDEEDHRDDEELIAISAMRPELFEVESLKELLKKGFSTNQGFKTAEQFKNAILSWLEKVNKRFASSESERQNSDSTKKNLIEKEHSRKELKSPSSKRWAKQYQGIKFIEAELREELNTLKTNQVKSEATMSMLLSRKLAAKRQRKSPVRAITEVTLIATAVMVAGGTVITYVSTNYESIKTKYFVVARALTKPTAKILVETDQPIELLDYRQDSAYKRWTNSKVFGPPRRIETNGQLREKQ